MQLSKRDVIPNQVQDNNNSNNLGTKKKNVLNIQKWVWI